MSRARLRILHQIRSHARAMRLLIELATMTLSAHQLPRMCIILHILLTIRYTHTNILVMNELRLMIRLRRTMPSVVRIRIRMISRIHTRRLVRRRLSTNIRLRLIRRYRRLLRLRLHLRLRLRLTRSRRVVAISITTDKPNTSLYKTKDYDQYS